jgi:signal transduction histidine kinase
MTRGRLAHALSSLLLAALWALAAPVLSELAPSEAADLRPWLAVAGLATGLLFGAGRAGPRGALIQLGRLSLGGFLVGAVGALALALAHRLGAATALALGLCAFGLAVACGLVLARASATANEIAERGPPLRWMIAGTCGALTVAAWALASGHVLGQRTADATRHAVGQARDLVSIVAARAIVGGELRGLGALAPTDGYLVTVDDAGRVLSGVGVAVPTGSTLALAAAGEAGPFVCTTQGRTLPCAVRRLTDGSRVVAAVERAPIAGDVMLAFALAGVLVALGAILVGRLVGAATASDLGRVTKTLDRLGRGPHGLDRKIVVASLDEVGDLAAALGRLRAHLRPALAEYETALEKAQAADRARDEFLQLVSAELRTPLDQIVSGARALLDPASEKLSAEQTEDVRIVLSSSLHLVDLIDEVLDVSAIATGQVNLKLEDCDLGRVVGDVAKAQRPIVQNKGVEVRLDVGEPSPRARADEKRIRQVITNIISNAAKFTEKGSIEVWAKHHGAGEVELGVRDTGPGIDPKQLPRLFTEFVQLGSLKQRAHGTGLGLAICKRLVEAHGGKVAAESTPGVGSTFRVTLPVGGPPTKEKEENISGQQEALA